MVTVYLSQPTYLYPNQKVYLDSMSLHSLFYVSKRPHQKTKMKKIKNSPAALERVAVQQYDSYNYSGWLIFSAVKGQVHHFHAHMPEVNLACTLSRWRNDAVFPCQSVLSHHEKKKNFNYFSRWVSTPQPSMITVPRRSEHCQALCWISRTRLRLYKSIVQSILSKVWSQPGLLVL